MRHKISKFALVELSLFAFELFINHLWDVFLTTLYFLFFLVIFLSRSVFFSFIYLLIVYYLCSYVVHNMCGIILLIVFPSWEEWHFPRFQTCRGRYIGRDVWSWRENIQQTYITEREKKKNGTLPLIGCGRMDTLLLQEWRRLIWLIFTNILPFLFEPIAAFNREEKRCSAGSFRWMDDLLP